jgi:hypothetical protein
MVLRSILGPKGEEVTKGELTICSLLQILLGGWQASRLHVKHHKCAEVLVGKHEGKGPLGKCRLRCKTSRVESYITTDGLSANLSWNKAPTWGLRPDFYCCQTVAGLFMWGALLTRGCVNGLQLLVAFASTVILGSESQKTRCHILLSQIRDFPFCRLLRL